MTVAVGNVRPVKGVWMEVDVVLKALEVVIIVGVDAVVSVLIEVMSVLVEGADVFR
jgi:hypothetical protein